VRKEAQARFEAALKGAMNAPHKPLKEKPKAKKKRRSRSKKKQMTEESKQPRQIAEIAEALAPSMRMSALFSSLENPLLQSFYGRGDLDASST